MLGYDSNRIEVVSTGQQTAIQSVSEVSTSSTEQENLLDYLKTKEQQSGQTQLTRVRQKH